MIAGIFAGGAATRMGGADKALLPAPGGGTLLERWAALFRGANVPCVVVGSKRYEGFESIADRPPGIGPLGGLIALLERASPGYAIAVACDMPRVSSELLSRLISAPDAPIVAPRRGEVWEPLFARYDASVVLPRARDHAARGVRSLQALMIDATPLAVSDPSELDDWDEPAALR